MLTKTKTFTQSIEIPSSHAPALLSILHDPQQLCSQHPLILSIVQDPSDHTIYRVTHVLPIVPGFLQSTTTYKARIVNTEKGVKSQSWAAMGVTNELEYIVEDLGGGQSLFREEANVTVRTGLCESRQFAHAAHANTRQMLS